MIDRAIRLQENAPLRSLPSDIGETPEFNRLLWKSETVQIGRFHAPVEHPRFKDSGAIPQHVVVFPRSSVTIRHAGGRSFATDPTRTAFYNRGQEYTRTALDQRGDHCDWFAFPTSLVVEALAEHGIRPGADSNSPFRFSYLSCDRSTYLTQRLLVRRLMSSAKPDALFVEETALQVLRQATRPDGSDRPADESGSRAHRELADSARAVLACRYRDTMQLPELAEELGCSVFHLCRVFRRETGRTLHQHRNELRLRAALQILPERQGRLTEVAYDLGYSSHAHLTDSFRRAFGFPPSSYLERLRCGDVPSRLHQ